MLAITAYSDPIPIDVAPVETAQIQENNDNEEKSSFAEILAGLMQNVQSEDGSSAQDVLDALALEKTKDGNKLNLFANALDNEIDIDSIAQADDLPASGLFNLLEDDAAENQFKNIFNDENVLNASLETDVPIDDLSGDVLAEISPRENINNEKLNQSAELKNDLTSAVKSAETSDAQMLNAANLASEAEGVKKAKASSENQNAFSENDDAQNSEAVSKNSAGDENAASLVKREEGVSKLDEMRSKIRKDKVTIEVRDLRTAQGIPNNTDKGYALVETAAGRNGQVTVQEITLDLRLPDYGQNSQAQNMWEAKAGNALESMLARELHQNFNGDIVRHASIALRDGGAGTIKIALHPETLGNVKIHLEMVDNKITGHIVVESQEALNAFRKEIASLEQAFRDSGFADANLDLNLSADNSGNQDLDDNSFLRQMASNSYDGFYEQESASVIDVFFGHKTGSVNMLA